MKLFNIKCDQCEESVNIVTLSKKFDNFTIGQVKCENGHIQKRYLSEADILIYFGFSTIVYSVAYLIIINIFLITGVNLLNMLIIVAIFVFLFIALKYIGKYIFLNAPFKQEMKNFIFDEDEKIVARRTKWQFIMFLLVTFMLGVNPQYTSYIVVLLSAFIVVTFIKVHYQVKNEKEIFNNSNK
jgi:hypothetical protein